MRKLIRKALRILDGTPQVYGKKERGQSTVELALITPLLIILLVGLVEIGWFARNYLTLLEVTRVGARRGATLTAETSPMVWDERASLYWREEYDPYWLDYPPGNKDQPESRGWYTEYRANVRDCSALGDSSVTPNQAGFYNIVWCQMQRSMAPLEIDFDNGIDDVIISVFAVQVINHRTDGSGGLNLHAARLPLMDRLSVGTEQEFPEEGYIPVVVGRWPARANECNVWRNVLNPETLQAYSIERDPFDYYNQFPERDGDPEPTGGVDVYAVTYDPDGAGGEPPIIHMEPLELAVEDGGGWRTINNGYDPYPTSLIDDDLNDHLEVQRGFSVTGQHRVENTLVLDGGGGPVEFAQVCWGSEKTVYWMQDQLYGGEFLMSPEEIAAMRLEVGAGFCTVEVAPGVFEDCDQREYLANNGVILVEMYWQHQLLLDIPVFSPIYNALDDDQTTVHVWSAFPAPSVVPELRPNLTAQDLIGE